MNIKFFVMWNRQNMALIAAVVAPVLTGCSRLGNDPSSWLMVIIPAAAAIAFLLQILKDW